MSDPLSFDDLVPAQPSQSQGPQAFDTPTPASTSSQDDMFSDLVPQADKSYIGASFQRGLRTAPAAIARVIDAVNPFTTNADEAAELYKNDPEGYARWKNSGPGFLANTAQSWQESGDAQMNLLAPDQTEIAAKSYATLDPKKSAFLSPSKLVGDAVGQVPTIAALMATSIFSKQAAAKAFDEAIAAGATPGMAKSAAMNAAANAGSTTAQVSMGGLGYGQSYNDASSKILEMPPEQLLQNPKYVEYLKANYTPEVAKQLLASEYGAQAGAGAAATAAYTEGIGGRILGHSAAAEGQSMLNRVGTGVATEGMTNAVQNVGQQISTNLAGAQTGATPNAGMFDDLLEAGVSGFATGAGMGTGFGLMAGGKTYDAAKSQKEQRDTLRKSADSAGAAAVDPDGLTPGQAPTRAQYSVDPGTPATLTGVKAQVAQVATAAGVDPNSALVVAKLESNFAPIAKNKNSTAHGVFQMLDSTWDAMGGGDRNDVNVQVANGVKYLGQTQNQLENALGHPPSTAELYMGHLLGPTGAAEVLQAPGDMSILEAVRKYDPKNAEAIVNNNGMQGMTVDEAKAKWMQRTQEAAASLGLDPGVTAASSAKANPAEEAVAASQHADEDLAEIDALLAEQDSTPMSQGDLIEASKERTQTDKVGMSDQDPDIHGLDAALSQDPPGDPTTNQEERPPTLPMYLQGARPTWGLPGGKGRYVLDFDSHLDKAAYIVANEANKSKNDADYLKFLMDNTGMTEKEARGYGKTVKDSIRELVKTADHPDQQPSLNVPTGDAWQGEGPRGQNEAFISRDEQVSRQKYNNRNDNVSLGDTPVMASEDPSKAGKTLKDALPAPGEVVGVSHETNVAPRPYVEAATKTLQDWVRKFAGDSRVVLSFRTRDNAGRDVTSTAWYQRHPTTLGEKVYQINARPLYNHGVKEQGSINTTTQNKAAYSLAHEFGHLLVDTRLKEGMPWDLQKRVDNLKPDELFTPQELARMPEEARAVLNEYNERKRQVLNGPITPVEWANQWLGPWKLSHGWGDERGIQSFGRKFLGENWQNLTTKQLALTLDAHSQILSPHEYMAEQMSKYAYDQKLLEQSPLGTQQFFARALDTLRQFFRSLKGNKQIEAGTEFKRWVEGLTRLDQIEHPDKGGTAPDQPVKPKKPRIKLKLKADPIEEAPPLTPPPVETEAYSVQGTTTQTEPQQTQEMRRFMASDPTMRDLKQLDPGTHREILDMINSGQQEEAKWQIEQILGPEESDRMRWDMDDPTDRIYADTQHRFEEHFGQTTGLKSWLGNGMAQLRDSQYLVTTMRQMANRVFDVAGLQHINDSMTNYKALKAKLEVGATKAAQAWVKLGKEQRGLMEKMMIAEHHSGEHLTDLQNVNGKIRHVATERLAQETKRLGISEDTAAVYLATKNAYVAHINSLQQLLRKNITDRIQTPALRKQRLNELAAQFDEIRSRPFLAQTRFGQYAIHIRDTDGSLKHLEYFESKSQRDAAVTALKGKLEPGESIHPHNYDPTTSILRTMDPKLVSTYAQEFELTKRQRKEIAEQVDATTRRPQTRKYSDALAQVTGANKDLAMNFAHFMWHDSTGLAKMRYREEFNKGLRMIQEQRQMAADAVDWQEHDRLTKLLGYSDKYVKHILNPADEWQKVRSMVVVHQLWGSIKTAVANLNSLVQVAAVAGTKYKNGNRLFGKTALDMAVEQGKRMMNKVTKSTMEGYQSLAPDERWAMGKAQDAGVLDETFAAQLAGFANTDTLTRLNMNKTSDLMKRVAWMGMQPQHLIENYTRRVTFLTSFRGFVDSGIPKEEAFRKAVRETHLLQGDNSLMNRPEFMRGNASLFTIYYGYMQNMLYLMSGGYERARRTREAAGLEPPSKKYSSETLKMWLGFAALSGIMGLPGAEDADKILELVSEKMFGKRFSLHEHAFSMAKDISDNASQFGINVNPRSIVHGSLADVSLFGSPRVDLSGATSMGQAIPGMADVDQLDSKSGLGNFVLGAMGPFGGVVKQMIGSMQDDPSLMKKYGWILPGGLQNLAKGWSAMENGSMYPSGGKVTKDLDTGQIRDLTTGEVIAKMMGFQPSIESQNQEQHWMQADMQQYWVNRRNNMVAQYWEAIQQKDREAIADTRAEIARYNQEAPLPAKITGQELTNSIAGRRKRAMADQNARPEVRGWTKSYSDISKTFQPAGQ